jgi:hypothetical protein
LRTRPRPQSAVLSAAAPHTGRLRLYHTITVAVGSCTTAVKHCDCGMHDQRTRLAPVRSMDCQRQPPPPTKPHSHCNAAVTHTCTQRSGTRCIHTSDQQQKNNRTQRSAVTHPLQADTVQQRTRDNTNPQSQCSGTAPRAYSLALFSEQPRQCMPKTRVKHREYDTATIVRIIALSHHRSPNAHLTHMQTSAALPTTITTHWHTRAQTHAMQQAPPCTTPRQRGACHLKTVHAKTVTPRTAHRALTRSIQTPKSCTPAGRPAQQ